jgi:hypothetical protein
MITPYGSACNLLAHPVYFRKLAHVLCVVLVDVGREFEEDPGGVDRRV